MDPVEAELLGRVAGALLAPERLAHLERVIEQTPARTEVETSRLVLLALPADADAEVDSTMREHVERGHLLREHGGTAQCREQHVRAEANAGRLRCDACQHGERFEPVPVGSRRLLPALQTAAGRSTVGVELFAEHDVIGDDDAVDARVVGRPSQIEDVSPAPPDPPPRTKEGRPRVVGEGSSGEIGLHDASQQLPRVGVRERVDGSERARASSTPAATAA